MLSLNRDPSLAVHGGLFADGKVPLTSGMLVSCTEPLTLRPMKWPTSEKKVGKRPRGAEMGS
jgi:hypothetical protein